MTGQSVAVRMSMQSAMSSHAVITTKPSRVSSPSSGRERVSFACSEMMQVTAKKKTAKESRSGPTLPSP